MLVNSTVVLAVSPLVSVVPPIVIGLAALAVADPLKLVLDRKTPPETRKPELPV